MVLNYLFLLNIFGKQSLLFQTEEPQKGFIFFKKKMKLPPCFAIPPSTQLPWATLDVHFSHSLNTYRFVVAFLRNIFYTA